VNQPIATELTPNDAAAPAIHLPPGDRRLRIAVVGCGDVAFRRYLPTLGELGAEVEVRACIDGRSEAADRAATTVAGWSPDARAYPDLATALAAQPIDAAFNITPAPAHAEVNQACLDAGLHVYSEKPLAGSLVEADRLIATARAAGLRFLVAPGVAAMTRFRWLAEIVASGRLGPLTLATAHHADSGPATWREYTGDPTVFYGPGVGPVFDHGIYRLHALTLLMGPVRRVQAMGAISRPTRIVRAGPLAGRTIPIAAPDHIIVNLEFASGALGQLLASFGTANTQAPWLELHFAAGTISLNGESHDKDAPASLYLDDDSPLGLEGWIHDLQPPPTGEPWPVVETGIRHFIACLRGRAEPVLTPEHARHVLDVVLKAYASIQDGASHETETTF
jgi:predicted dehydrogenase